MRNNYGNHSRLGNFLRQYVALCAATIVLVLAPLETGSRSAVSNPK